MKASSTLSQQQIIEKLLNRTIASVDVTLAVSDEHVCVSDRSYCYLFIHKKVDYIDIITKFDDRLNRDVVTVIVHADGYNFELFDPDEIITFKF